MAERISDFVYPRTKSVHETVVRRAPALPRRLLAAAATVVVAVAVGSGGGGVRDVCGAVPDPAGTVWTGNQQSSRPTGSYTGVLNTGVWDNGAGLLWDTSGVSWFDTDARNWMSG
ncbi:MAG: hypothetical protein LBR07_06665, partial [Puniceicoccales bacterium]|nr:hypothetical protein [Puniceicoccales bacterium]